MQLLINDFLIFPYKFKNGHKLIVSDKEYEHYSSSDMSITHESIWGLLGAFKFQAVISR